MNVVVRKYGGSSLATPEQAHRVAAAVAAAHRAGQSLVVVVSARGDATDALLTLAGEIDQPPDPRETDQLLATAECVSAALLTMALKKRDIRAISLTGPQAGITAEGKHGDGIIADVDPARISSLLHDGNVVVVAGFQGVNPAGDLLTLGRGGSDVTAVALAGTLDARSCEIYTDVDGVYSADPRAVDDPRILPSVDAGVMAEMAFAGAKVLHPRAVELASMYGVDLRVLSAHGETSNNAGTIIQDQPHRATLETRGVVVAVTHDLDVCRVLVHSWGSRNDLAAEVLGVLSQRRIPVDLVARSGPQEDEFRMGFTVRRSDLDEARAALQGVAAEQGGAIDVNEDVAKLSLVGMGLLNRPEYTARLLSTLAAANIPTSWVSTSQLRTSVTVPLDHSLDALELLHQEFSLERNEIDAGALAPA